MLRYVRWGLLWLFVCSGACARQQHDALLIRIDAVEQSFERPFELLLRGDGFPQGMRGEAHLRGALYAAGTAPRAVDLLTTCRGLSAQKARVELDTLSALVAGEGPFEGQIELRFGTQESAQLLGRKEGALFRIGAVPAIEEQFTRSKRAERFQRALGIDAMEHGDDGLIVAELSPSSPALRAGLAAHDVVLRIDGRPVQLARDLVSLEETETVLLEVRRARESTTRLVRISTTLARSAPDLALVALALVLGLGATVVLLSALPSHLLWAPRRREYWLLLCCAVCIVGLAALIVRDVDPLLSRMCGACAVGAVLALPLVYLQRRISPTLHTGKDVDLAPLL
jgi:hypothetical protein